LFGRLTIGLVLDDVCSGSSFDLREITQLSNAFHLVVGLEKFSIELVLEFKGDSDRPKTVLLLVVDTQIVDVKIF